MVALDFQQNSWLKAEYLFLSHFRRRVAESPEKPLHHSPILAFFAFMFIQRIEDKRKTGQVPHRMIQSLFIAYKTIG